MTTDNYDLEAGGVKFDAGKLRMDLVPMESVLAEAAVYTYGAVKYDDWNWAKGMRKGRIVAALFRHTAAYLLGEEIDEESGLPHTWHMRCCTGMLVAAEARGVAEEDREINVDAYKYVMEIAKGMREPVRPEGASEEEAEEEAEEETLVAPQAGQIALTAEEFAEDHMELYEARTARMVDWNWPDTRPRWFKEGRVASFVKTDCELRMHAPFAPVPDIVLGRTARECLIVTPVV